MWESGRRRHVSERYLPDEGNTVWVSREEPWMRESWMGMTLSEMAGKKKEDPLCLALVARERVAAQTTTMQGFQNGTTVWLVLQIGGSQKNARNRNSGRKVDPERDGEVGVTDA